MSDRIKEALVEWAVGYFRNKDIVSRKMTGMSENKDNVDLLILYIDGACGVAVEPFLDDVDAVLKRLEKFKDSKSSLIVYNTSENLSKVISSWDKLAKFSAGFSIIFVNPYSSLDTKWAIFPMVHDRIIEKKDLSRGLKSLFSNVEETNKEKLSKLVK